MIEKVSQRLCGQGNKCLEILSNENFDVLYSVIYFLDEQSIMIKN